MNKEMLEANLGDRLEFPVTFTLLLNLSGMGADAKPDLQNSEFMPFKDERWLGTCHPMANMPNMCR